MAFSYLLSGLSPFVGGIDVSRTGFCWRLAPSQGWKGVLEGPQQDPSDTVCWAFTALHLAGQASGHGGRRECAPQVLSPICSAGVAACLGRTAPGRPPASLGRRA